MKLLCLSTAPILVSLVSASLASAAETPITLGSPVSGTISTETEIDWYSVTTDVVGDLTVTQTAWPPFIETRIAIFGPNSQTTAQSNPVTAAAPGTYYIKVWSANGGTSTDVYTFTATLTQAGTGNDTDGGKNAASAAVPIAVGTAVSDTIAPSKETAGKQDVDWFTFTTDVVGDLTVTQTAWPPFIETRIALFGPTSATLAQSNPALAAAPGTYYVMVSSANDGSSIAPYTFSVSLTKAATGNDIDGGKNSATGAVPITVGVPVSDTIAPSKETAGKQDVDWFSLTTTAIGDLTVTQTVWPPFIETAISVFGPNSDTLAQTSPIKAAAPGTYYIKVWSANDGSSIAPYTFTVQHTGSVADAGMDARPPDASLAVSDGPGADVGRADAAALDGATADSTSGDVNGIDRAISVDVGMAVDGGAMLDGAVAFPIDSGIKILPAVDGGPDGGDEPSNASGGCGGCRVASRSSRTGSVVLVLLGLALALVRRRRTRD
jgi:MYXO-CTERM domain-containing protein